MGLLKLLGDGIGEIGDALSRGASMVHEDLGKVVDTPFNLVQDTLTGAGKEIHQLSSDISENQGKMRRLQSGETQEMYKSNNENLLARNKHEGEARAQEKKEWENRNKAFDQQYLYNQEEEKRKKELHEYKKQTLAENLAQSKETHKWEGEKHEATMNVLNTTAETEEVNNFGRDFAAQISQNNPNMGGAIVQEAVANNPNVKQLGYMKLAYNYLDKYFAGDAKSGDNFIRVMAKTGVKVSRDKDGNFIDEKGQPITRETFNTLVDGKMGTTIEEIQDYAEVKMATDDLYKNAYNYGVDEYLKYSGDGNDIQVAKKQLNLFLERFTPEQRSWAALHRFVQDLGEKDLPPDRLQTRISGAAILLQQIDPAYRLDFSGGEPSLYLPDGGKISGLNTIKIYIKGKDEITPQFDKWKESMEGAAKMREQEAQALQAKERAEVTANIERQVNELANFTGVKLNPIEEKIKNLTSTLFARRDYQPRLMRQAAEIIGEQKSSFQSIYDNYDTTVANAKNEGKIAVAGVERDVALLKQYQKIVDKLNTDVKIDVEGTERKFAIGGTVEDLIGKKEYYRLMISQAKKNLSSWFIQKKTSSVSSAPINVLTPAHTARGAKDAEQRRLENEIKDWTKKYEEELAKETPSQSPTPQNLTSKEQKKETPSQPSAPPNLVSK